MKKNTFRSGGLVCAALFALMPSMAGAGIYVITDPALNIGTNAVNKANRSLIAASGAVPEATLEGLPGFSGIGSFNFSGNVAVTNEYIYSFTADDTPDLRLRYLGAVSNHAIASTVHLTNATFSTSTPDSMRTSANGINRLFTMRIDAGTCLLDSFTTNRGLRALGFTLSMSASSPAITVYVGYYDKDGNLLSTQTLQNGTAAGTYYRYTGYETDGAPIAYAEMVYSTAGLASAPVVSLDDLSFAKIPKTAGEFFYAPPPQTAPVVYNRSGDITGRICLSGVQDATVNLTGDCTGNLNILGGRHIRIIGNGYTFSGRLLVGAVGGDWNVSGGNVGYGSLYVEGVHFLKPYPRGTVNEDCLHIANPNSDGLGGVFNDGRKLDVIIQNNRFENINGDIDYHGDAIQFAAYCNLKVGLFYLYRNTMHTGYQGIAMAPASYETVSPVKKMCMAETNIRQFFIPGDYGANWPCASGTYIAAAAMLFTATHDPLSKWPMVYCGDDVYIERGDNGGHLQEFYRLMFPGPTSTTAPLQTSSEQMWYAHSNWWSPGRINLGIPPAGNFIEAGDMSAYSSLTSSNFYGQWVVDTQNNWLPYGAWSTVWTGSVNFSAVYPLEGKSGTRSIEFDLLPIAPTNGSIIGYAGSSTVIDSVGKMSIVLRCNNQGYIDCLNGSVYEAVSRAPYTQGKSYRIKINAYPDTKTYDAWVKTPANPAGIRIASSYNFSTGAPLLSDWGKLCLSDLSVPSKINVINHVVK